MADNCYVVEPPPSDNPPRTPFRRAALSRAQSLQPPWALRPCGTVFAFLFCSPSVCLLRRPFDQRAFFTRGHVARFLGSRGVSTRLTKTPERDRKILAGSYVANIVSRMLKRSFDPANLLIEPDRLDETPACIAADPLAA